MSILFNCPYCTAPIRVPDAYSGKRGRCPKCQTRVIVPDVVPPEVKQQLESGTVPSSRPMTPPAVPPPVSVPQPPVSPQLPPTVSPPSPPSPPSPAAEGAPMPVPDISSPDVPAEPAGPAGAGESEVPIPVAPVPEPPISRRLKKKKARTRSQRILRIAVPLSCFLAFFGVVAIVALTTKPELKGNLRGTSSPDYQPAAENVSLGLLNLTEDQASQVRTAFESAPESFLSNQMKCTVSLKDGSLSISVKALPGYAWFAVNPNSNSALAAWIRDHRVALNKRRLKLMTDTGRELCLDKIRIASGEPIVLDAMRYRNDFALAAHVDAFGFAVNAYTSDRQTPCAHEDSNGTIWFVLPEDTRTFQLRGRRTANGKPLFPGEYTVHVAETKPPPVTDDSATKTPESETPESKAPEMDEPDMNAPKMGAPEMAEPDTAAALPGLPSRVLRTTMSGWVIAEALLSF